jgi:hypothetical protein
MFSLVPPIEVKLLEFDGILLLQVVEEEGLLARSA